MLSFLDMRVIALGVVALLAAVQGGEAAARGSRGGFSHGGGARFHSAPVARPFVSRSFVRVVPRAVFVAPIVPYYPTPAYYPPAPAYYPPSSYYPPDTTAYVEQSPGYSPGYAPPPPPPVPQGSSAQPGQYSIERGTQYRYLCLDTRKFYPDTKECASGWLTVLPGGRPPPQ